jgi:hypothetical protein
MRTLSERYNLTLNATSWIMVVLCLAASLKVGYETIWIKGKAQFLVVYGLLVLTMLYWLTLLLN